MKWIYAFAFCSCLMAADYSKLPDWAEAAMKSVNLDQAPDADVWRLVDDTQLNYVDGGLEVERKIVQVVLRDRGSDEASVYLVDGDEQTRTIKKLKGWHLRANGKLDKLDRSNVLTIGQANADVVSRETTTFAVFEYVAKGSVVVFNSKERDESFLGPSTFIRVLGSVPVRQRSIRTAATSQGRFELLPLMVDDWKITAEVSQDLVVFHDVPELGDQILLPRRSDQFPRILVRHNDGGEFASRYASWDAFAKWYHGVFVASAGITAKATSAVNADDLATALESVQSRVRYKQVYLNPASGWKPTAGSEVMRRAYGDCKDMVSCLADLSQKKNIQVLPVLASIAEGSNTREDSPVAPSFNHLIAAIPLPASLGMAAEFSHGEQRYLLIDPTSRNTPLGYLPFAYRNRNLLICTPQGAVWHAVADEALEQGELSVTLEGRVDEQFTLSGQIRIVETGNSYGLRSSLANDSSRDLDWIVRSTLDIPSQAILKRLETQQVSGTTTLTYGVGWPSFLRRDAFGFRLPDAVVPYPRSKLTRADQKRWAPIALVAYPKQTWILNLALPLSLKPGQDQYSWNDANRSFSWICQVGSPFSVRFESFGHDRLYAGEKLAEGVEAWSGYRSQYNEFYKSVTLLTAN